MLSSSLRLSIAALAATTVVAVACGGSVTTRESASGAGGAGNASSASGPSSTGDTGVTSNSSAQSGPGTTVGAGGAPACGETHEMVTIQLATWDGLEYGCTLGQTEVDEIAITGAVIESDGSGSFQLDSCPPNADCDAMVSKVYVAAPGLFFYVPVGTFVDVRVTVFQVEGCMNAIQVKNRPSWGGVENPIASGTLLWLSAADGATFTFDDSPFAIEPLPLGCYPDEPPGCGVHDDFVLRFFDVDEPGNSTTLGMGQAHYGWFVESGLQSEYLAVNNLRSYSTGYCDDYWNWAWWVTQGALDE